MNQQHLFNVSKKAVHKDMMVFTLSDHQSIPLTDSYLQRLGEIKTPWKLVICCIDQKTFQYYRLKYPFCLLVSSIPSRQMTQLKFQCFQKLFSFPLKLKKIVFTNTDIFVYRDFFENVLNNYNDADFYSQSEHFGLTEPSLGKGFIVANKKLFHHKQFSHSLLPRNLFGFGESLEDITIDTFLINYNGLEQNEKTRQMISRGHLHLPCFQPGTDIRYPPFNVATTTIEEYFYEFQRNKSGNQMGLIFYLPLFWTNIFNHGINPDTKIQELGFNGLSGLFTVVQHDDGLRDYIHQFPNLKIFSAGHYYPSQKEHIIPLIYEDGGYLNQRRNQWDQQDKKYLGSFVGSATHPLRTELYELFKDDKDFYFSMKEWTNKVVSFDQEEFISKTLESKFGFAPRGYGCTSFRLYEIFKLGVVPVFIHDDELQIPYQDVFDFNEICVLCHIKDLSGLKSKLLAIKEDEYEAMLTRYQEVKDYFTMSGMCRYILSKI